MLMRFEERLRSLGYASYDEYLRSEHWVELKARYWSKWTDLACVGCDEKAVELHHVNYQRLGDEGLRDLIPLCRICHSDMHAFLKVHRWVHISDIYASVCGAFGISFTEASQRLAGYHSLLAKNAHLSIRPRPQAKIRKRNQTQAEQYAQSCSATSRKPEHTHIGKIGPDGEPRELRIGPGLEYGEEVIELRIWEMTPVGRWNPTRRSVSIREHEAEDVARAIRLAVEEIHRRGSVTPKTQAQPDRMTPPWIG